MPDFNGDGIITKDEIVPTIQNYYSKQNMQQILNYVVNNNNINSQFRTEINKRFEKLEQMITGGVSGGIYSKEEIDNKLKSLSVETVGYTLEIIEDNQTEFDLSELSIEGNLESTVLFYNSTVRTDYMINNKKLITEFEVPLNAILILLVNEIKIPEV